MGRITRAELWRLWDKATGGCANKDGALDQAVIGEAWDGGGGEDNTRAVEARAVVVTLLRLSMDVRELAQRVEERTASSG